jgi:hypothetical protein
MNTYRVTYTYGVDGWDGRREKKVVQDCGLIQAHTPEEAMDQVAALKVPVDRMYGPDYVWSERHSVRLLMSAREVIRVRLKTDFVDELGQRFVAGQLGSTRSLTHLPSLPGPIVDFDGYEAARAKHEELQAKFGEGFNVVPWAAFVPVALLEVLKD